ncbi:MAG: pirin family protein [Eubacteriaceae bacterium]|nr:pirin family protein [Eubacteriaceae bacterium]
MTEYRKIKKITKGNAAVDGAGVHLVRVIGFNDVNDYDPFLMLDAFDSEDPDDYTAGFPWHPHRGIETVTYLIKGDIEHGDNLGNSGSIKDGECQWMTAGSGIIHQEMPKPSEHMLGAQLWINLPAKDKMTAPKYGDIKSADVPVITEEGTKIHVIAGRYLENSGAFRGSFVDASYLDVEMEPGSSWDYESEAGSTLFVYVVTGSAAFEPDGEVRNAKQALLFGEGRCISVSAGSGGVRFLLLSAQPLHEPVAWGGPIVMNTEDELNEAFRELDDGTFIR